MPASLSSSSTAVQSLSSQAINPASSLSKVNDTQARCVSKDMHPSLYAKDKGLLTRIRKFITRRGSTSRQEKEDLRRRQDKYLSTLTIAPKAAQSTMKYIQYDGIGRVCDVKKTLPKQVLKTVLDAVIQPLPETPVKRTTDAKISPGEALVDLYSALERDGASGVEAKEFVLDRIKTSYLCGAVQRANFMMVTDLMEVKLGSPSASLSAETDMLAQRLSPQATVTMLNDNYYGRVFDSEFSAHIVNNRNETIDALISDVARELADDFSENNDSDQRYICRRLAESLERDFAPWINDIETAMMFLENPNPERLNALLMTDSNVNYRADLILSVAVKYMMFSPGYSALRRQCDDLYANVITLQRNFEVVKSSLERGNHYGITLAYQRNPSNSVELLGKGRRPIDCIKPSMDGRTQHDQLALQRERAVGIGMSGSANMLNALFHDIEQRHPGFPVKDAQLMAAAHLTFSGGHSINEAFTTFNYATRGSFLPTSYADLGHYYSSTQSSALCDAAIEKAFRAMVDASHLVSQ